MLQCFIIIILQLFEALTLQSLCVIARFGIQTQSLKLKVFKIILISRSPKPSAFDESAWQACFLCVVRMYIPQHTGSPSLGPKSSEFEKREKDAFARPLKLLKIRLTKRSFYFFLVLTMAFKKTASILSVLLDSCEPRRYGLCTTEQEFSREPFKKAFKPWTNELKACVKITARYFGGLCWATSA